MKLELTQIEGPEPNQVHLYSRFPIYMGRDSSNDLVFPADQGEAVSQVHLKIFFRDGRFHLQDLGSTNGTLIDGKAVRRRKLDVGTRFRLGPEGPLLEVSDVVIADRDKAKTSLSQTRRFAAAPATGSLTPRELEIARDIWQAISWRFKLLYGTIVLLLACLAFLVIHQQQLTERLPTRDLERAQRDLDKKRQQDAQEELEELHRRSAAFRQSLTDQYQNQIARLEDELKTLRKSQSQNQDKKKITTLERTLSHLQSKIDKNQPAAVRFKQIQKKYEKSVLFIYTRVQVYNPQSNKNIPVTSFGTGFLVSKDGHVVTNKHVIQPWKFGVLAEQIALLNCVVKEDTQIISAWPSGEKVMDFRKNLDFSRGYNNYKLHNLRVVNLAEDSWKKQEAMIAPGQMQKYRVHRNDDFDLALLRIKGKKGETFDYLPLATTPLPVEKLDPVLILGYPKGTALMDSGRGQTSPSVGTIRKVEDALYVSASIIPGNSGGPVLAQNGEVVGICTRVYQKTETLGVCIKVDQIWKLLPHPLRRQLRKSKG